MTRLTIKCLLIVFTVFYTLLSGSSSIQPPSTAIAISSPVTDIPKESATPSLVLFSSREQDSLLLQQASDLFLEDFSGVRIQVHTVAGESNYHSALRARLLSGEQTDLFQFFGYRDAQELLPYFKDFSDESWVLEAGGNLLNPVTTEDSVWGVPHSAEAIGLLYNKKIWQAADIPIGSATTFEELEEAFTSLRQNILDDALLESFPNLKNVTEFPALDKDFLEKELANVLLAADLVSPQQTMLAYDLPLTLQAATSQPYVTLLTYHTSSRFDLPRLNQTPRSRQIQEGIASQRVALIQDSTARYSEVRAIAPDIAESLSLLPIPLPEEEQPYIYVGSPVYWAINKDSDEVVAKAAASFLKWLYTSDEGTRLLAEKFQLISPYPQSTSYKASQLDAQLWSYVEAGKARPWVYREFPTGFGTEGFGENLRQYFGGEATWNRAMSSMRQSWLSQYASEESLPTQREE